MLDAYNRVILNDEQANNIQFIYNSYLSGDSLGTITKKLLDRKIVSPTGKHEWTRAVVNRILSNGKYTNHIISEDNFYEVQFKKDRRSNINSDTGMRKTTKYNSQNVLSGLLICSDCGATFRRITRTSGDVVWRCGDRVEHGKSSKCNASFSLSESVIKNFICEELNLSLFDEKIVRNRVKCIMVSESNMKLIENSVSL